MAYTSKAPTDEQRKLVQTMAAAGIQSEAICQVIGVSGKTLRKHYRAELDTAVTRANAMVARSLYMKALKGNVVAQIFWLKPAGAGRSRSESMSSIPAPSAITICRS